MEEDEERVNQALKIQPLEMRGMSHKKSSMMKKHEEEEAKQKMEEANQKLKEYDEKLKKQLEPILDKKKQDKTFKSKLEPYNKPIYKIILGTFAALFAGLVAPLFGFTIMKNLFAIMMAQYEEEDVLMAVAPWVGMMIGLSLGIMIFKSAAVILFSTIGQNIVFGVR